MTHGSLFSGIGGFELAAEWMGWENVFHCEWNPFGQKVLKYYWPNSISYNDITKTDFTIHRGAIDILTGGFPCQPYSAAGKRLGKADERHLFPEMLRAIKEIKPRWIIGENVRGLVSWNGGMVFHEVHDDLEREGYEVQSFLIPAASVNAPHQRYRIFFVAYAKSARTGENFGGLRSVFDRCNTREENATSITNTSSDGFDDKPPTTNNIIGQDNIESGTQRERTIKGLSDERITTNTKCIRLEHGTDTGKVSGKETNAKREWNQSALPVKTNGNGYKSNWDYFPTVSPICSRDDGFPNRLDGITFSKWRNESIKAAGNAVVPQVVLQLFKAIEKFELNNN
jgi:DNA (cytosine-5)-methyltransferase 1